MTTAKRQMTGVLAMGFFLWAILAAVGANRDIPIRGEANLTARWIDVGGNVLLPSYVALGSGGLPLQQNGSGNQVAVGTLTNNNAAPAATNLGVLGGLANAAAPSWTEGNQVLLSTNLLGDLRVIAKQSTSPWVSAGNLTNNSAAPGTANTGVLPALANAAAPSWTEGNQTLLSTNLTGDLRVLAKQSTSPWTVAGANTPADAFATPTTAVPPQTFPQVSNGTTWDMLRGANAANSTGGTGLLGSGLLVWDGVSVWNRLATAHYASSDTNNVNGANLIPVAGFGFLYTANSSNWERMSSNKAAPTTSNRLAVALGTGNMTSLSAVTAAGAGTAFNLGVAHHEFGVQLTTTGTPTTVSVTLQGSLDGTTWTNIGSPITGTGTSLTFFTGSPVTNVRLNLGTFAGGTSPTLTGILDAY